MIFVNSDGKFVSEDGLVAVQLEGQYGSAVLPVEGLGLAKETFLTLVEAKRPRTLHELQYEYGSDNIGELSSDGYREVILPSTRKYGLVDAKGREVIPPIHLTIVRPFGSKDFVSKDGTVTILIDSELRTVRFDDVAVAGYRFNTATKSVEGPDEVTAKAVEAPFEAEKVAGVPKSAEVGSEVPQWHANYAEVKPLDDNFSIVKSAEGKWGVVFIDGFGGIYEDVPTHCQEIINNGNGTVKVRIADKWGIVDYKYSVDRIETKYDSIEFDAGLNVYECKLGDKFDYYYESFVKVDSNGTLDWHSKYDRVDKVNDSLSFVIFAREGKKVSVFDEAMQFVGSEDVPWRSEYTWISDQNIDGNYMVQKGHMVGLVNNEGLPIIPVECMSIVTWEDNNYFKNGLALIQKGDGWWFANTEGADVGPIRGDRAKFDNDSLFKDGFMKFDHYGEVVYVDEHGKIFDKMPDALSGVAESAIEGVGSKKVAIGVTESHGVKSEVPAWHANYDRVGLILWKRAVAPQTPAAVQKSISARVIRKIGRLLAASALLATFATVSTDNKVSNAETPSETEGVSAGMKPYNASDYKEGEEIKLISLKEAVKKGYLIVTPDGRVPADGVDWKDENTVSAKDSSTWILVKL